MAVLTNHGTADAAEVVAAALMDNKRAQVVGERTYGDAAMRKAITMEDGGAIILSVAKYYSPDGKAIQDTGVTPQTAVMDTEGAGGVRRKRRAACRKPGRPNSPSTPRGRSRGEKGVGSAGSEGSAGIARGRSVAALQSFQVSQTSSFSARSSMSL